MCKSVDQSLGFCVSFWVVEAPYDMPTFNVQSKADRYLAYSVLKIRTKKLMVK